ncbi:MAG: zinc-dependent alcohol dehydrogenase family protein [Bacteroidetes bacterium]|nr:zinc-dependent alcohol dehydrogenase family protein [Bacteroidota bacterium]
MKNIMKAVVFEHAGVPCDVLRMTEVGVPEPGEEEVRVKMLASPINPADLLFINGVYRIKPQLPQIAGLEGVGIIDKVQDGSLFNKNALVAFRHKGLWAEYAIVPENKLIPLPNNFPLEKGCQLSLNPITAYALLDEADLTQDDWLLINAGNSAVSKIIMQLARLRGISTIVVTRDEKEAEGLDIIGATKILTSQSGDLAERILEITGHKGVACVLDAVGDQLLSELLTVMAPFGKVISYGLLGKGNVSYHNATVIFKNLTITGFGIDAWLSKKGDDVSNIYSSLVEAIAKPEFQMPVAAVFPMADFCKAFEYQKSNANTGKVLISINNRE